MRNGESARQYTFTFGGIMGKYGKLIAASV